jgi:hypothetical protein
MAWQLVERCNVCLHIHCTTAELNSLDSTMPCYMLALCNIVYSYLAWRKPNLQYVREKVISFLKSKRT